MKVYISGKIGEETLSEGTRLKFARAEKFLRQKGYEVFNPTTSGLGQNAEEQAKVADYNTSFYQEIMLLDLAQLARCDAILMLEDWAESPGANVELDFAMATGKQCFWQDEVDAKVYGEDAEKYLDVWLPII